MSRKRKRSIKGSPSPLKEERLAAPKLREGAAPVRGEAAPTAKNYLRAHPLQAVLLLVICLPLLTWLAAMLMPGLSILSRTESAMIPEIQTNGLDAAAMGLIQRHVDAVRSTPRSAAAWGKLGALLKSFSFREQAEQCLAQAERLDPKEPRWPYLQGVLRIDEPSVAVPRLRQAVALCGNEPEMPRLRLVRLLVESGKQDEAVAVLQQLLRAKPDSGPARTLMAQISQARGEWDQALAMASACTTNPYTARTAWTMLSALHRRRGDTNAAEFASRRAAAVTADAPWPDPFEDEMLGLRSDPRSLSDRAQAHLMAGRPADALPLVKVLVREHADSPETWLLLGRTQYLQNQPGAAEKSLRRFLELDPNSVNGHFQLGMSLLAQKRYPEAVATFRHATTLKRDFGPAFFNLGFALAKSGKTREAVAPFQEAIRQNPEMIDAYILLADLHVQLGEDGEAVRLANLAEQLNPADPRLPTLRGKIR